MRLNIETRDPEATKEALQSCYFKQEVTIEGVYPATATFRILDKYSDEEQCFPVLGLLDLPNFGIALTDIRIL